jgi:hypothetical protein
MEGLAVNPAAIGRWITGDEFKTYMQAAGIGSHVCGEIMSVLSSMYVREVTLEFDEGSIEVCRMGGIVPKFFLDWI